MRIGPRHTRLLLFGFLVLSIGLFAQADPPPEVVEDYSIDDIKELQSGTSAEEIEYQRKHQTSVKWNKEIDPNYATKQIKKQNGAEATWTKEKEKLVFTQGERKVRDDEYEPSQQDNNTFEGFNWGDGLQNLLIAFGCLLILGLILYFVQNGSFRQGKKILVDISDERLDWIEENLPEADVLTPLESAIQAKEYRKAIRLYFLLIVQQLTNAGDINWQKEKTNRAYILETYSQNYHIDFKSCVRIYESVWYGERQVSEEDFNKIEPVFKNLSSQLLSNIQAKDEE